MRAHRVVNLGEVNTSTDRSGGHRNFLVAPTKRGRSMRLLSWFDVTLETRQQHERSGSSAATTAAAI